jgi:propanol-preferring alcohol dehydrogenase
MKAAILNLSQDISRHPLRIDEVPQPSANPGQVLLKVRACGVCRTDLHIVEGELPKLREKLIPGHQIVGEIVEGATPDLPLGTRVGVS